MPTPEEAAFTNDPSVFMEASIIRVMCAKAVAGQYNFRLEQQNVPSARKNRKGARINYYTLTQNDVGEVPMWFLPYAANDVREFTLPVIGADLMVTVQLNGCTFGYAQSGANAGCYVTHHNAARQGNSPDAIEGQHIHNPFADPFEYFHQDRYRKRRWGKLDTNYFATIVGKRDAHNHWRFYAQKKKQVYNHLAGDAQDLWTLKGVVAVNP
ncbi:hypothetical protein [Rhodopila globiformis]|uniref:Uncharacterized protein n=1 Tax=Rhodopila globiformis TaxID=1071 RepID=A0A2S6NAK0_RHOGL|nr:hypothetical protein [Rhodopila globiformis]PPQ31627.1 hypothetical protein CCS01_17120 [Rhodopila globiformis]